jgi:hypothetical protein
VSLYFAVRKHPTAKSEAWGSGATQISLTKAVVFNGNEFRVTTKDVFRNTYLVKI